MQSLFCRSHVARTVPLLCALTVGCAKSPPAESARTASGDSYDQSEPATAPEAGTPESQPSDTHAPPSETKATGSPQPAGEASEIPPKSHDLTYHVSPEGIWIAILKARFRPSARMIKVPGGRIVEVEVEVETEEPYSLLAGENGPLAIAGRVRRPAEELRVDERGESKHLKVTPNKTETYKRRFPAGVIKPLKPGDQLEIRVGLWGFGEEDATLPVKRLFVVKAAPDKDSDHLEVLLPEGVAE